MKYYHHPVLIVGGAPVADAVWAAVPDDIKTVVAVDGGADRVIAQGLLPDVVVGDLDSLSSDARQTCGGRLIHIAEQDSTDFEKALRTVAAPLIIGIGFLGHRLDHQMAVQSALVSFPDKRIVLIGEQDIVFLAPPQIELPLDAGVRVSIYPMGAVSLRSQGLHWPTDGITMAPDGRIGTSNRATGPVMLQADRPKALVILPRAQFDQCLPAIASATPWNVRGE